MSSTTSATSSHPRERGQVLVLFAGAVFALLVVAAFAFDVGMMLLERRDAQDAADAAALGAARYVFDDDCIAANGWVCTRARATALHIASLNGYDGSDPKESVVVNIPPIDTNGRYRGLPNFVEVQIDSNRDSIFGGIIGRATWPVGVFAVATNAQDVSYPFSMIALNPDKCNAMKVTGTGSITAAGNIQSNSNGSGCPEDQDAVGFLVSGQASVDVFAEDAVCRSAGDIQQSGGGEMTCTQDGGSFILPDPLRNETPPAKPGLPADMVRIYPPAADPGPAIPSGCPGATNASTEAVPVRCDINVGKVKGTRWLLSPGLYPDGIRVASDAVAYLLPGTYFMGGGGITVGNGALISVGSQADAEADLAACPNLALDMGDSAGCLWPTWVDSDGDGFPDPPACEATLTCWDTGGVLVYNSELPTSAGGAINLGGGASVIRITAPLDDPNAVIDDIVIWQDENLCQEIVINGNSSYTEVAGLIYSPCGPVKVNGNTGTLVLDQVIADSFTFNGNGGNLTVLDRTDLEAEIAAAGLVD